MNNTITDLSTLTNIPEKLLEKLSQSLSYIICETVLEDELENKDITSIDMGFGTLYIKHSVDDLKFKFIPDTSFQENLKESLGKKLNLMENTLNNKLSNKLLEVYKELC